MISLHGLFKIFGDPNYGAAKLDGEKALLFKGANGRFDTRNPVSGTIDALSEKATMTETRDFTFKEAVAAHEENRPPRWLDSIFEP